MAARTTLQTGEVHSLWIDNTVTEQTANHVHHQRYEQNCNVE